MPVDAGDDELAKGEGHVREEGGDVAVGILVPAADEKSVEARGARRVH